MLRDDLIDALVYAMMAMQGCNKDGEHPVSSKGIDEKTGTINVYELLPAPGDSIMVVNCGSHFEIRHHHWAVAGTPPIHLTDEDIKRLKANQIVWN